MKEVLYGGGYSVELFSINWEVWGRVKEGRLGGGVFCESGCVFRKFEHRPKRSTIATISNLIHHLRNPPSRTPSASTSGLVFTDPLAALLQAVSFEIQKNIRFTFSKVMMALCNIMNTVLDILKADIMANPTLMMRTVLKRQAIIATAGGWWGHYIEIWPC